jgi:transcriptional regulator with XRE-family HTH domain
MLGDELKTARVQRGLSLERASAEAKISQGYLHKLEAGRVRSPSPRVLQRLAGALGLSYERLMVAAGYLVPGDVSPEEAVPVAAKANPTNAELLRQLEAVRAELAALTQAVERLAVRQ